MKIALPLEFAIVYPVVLIPLPSSLFEAGKVEGLGGVG